MSDAGHPITATDPTDAVRDWFAEHMPAVRTELRSKAGVYTDRDPELYEEIRAQGDAAIVGVGH